MEYTELLNRVKTRMKKNSYTAQGINNIGANNNFLKDTGLSLNELGLEINRRRGGN